MTGEQQQQSSSKDQKKEARAKKLESTVLQGKLPFQGEQYFEQANPIARSCIFRVVAPKSLKETNDWTPVFSISGESIFLKGATLLADHEEIWTKLLAYTRGRSIFKPVSVTKAELVEVLGLGDSGSSFAKVEQILEDLRDTRLRVSSRPALEKLVRILTTPSASTDPDTVSYANHIKLVYGEHIKLLTEGLANGEDVDIEMGFLTNRTRNKTRGREVLNLDPLTCLLFDGVNTTLVPHEVRRQLDAFGKRFMTFVASHRDGVYDLPLESYFHLAGYNSTFEKMGRKFKSQMKTRLEEYEEKKFIEPGWSFQRSKETGDWKLCGLKRGPALKIGANTLEFIPAAPEPEDSADPEIEAEDAIFQEMTEQPQLGI
ncbi:hypothetical protein HNP46_000120 [Pseudomonas nitritireducens]|uniref:TrfA protein n=2 Tax=Pseudomonas nitroreducens TaxID=46680 RepID=A0A7W7KFF8_PSENT|nr:hypothetical protein [Pseudomonas nitritireducens]